MKDFVLNLKNLPDDMQRRILRNLWDPDCPQILFEEYAKCDDDFRAAMLDSLPVSKSEKLDDWLNEQLVGEVNDGIRLKLLSKIGELSEENKVAIRSYVLNFGIRQCMPLFNRLEVDEQAELLHDADLGLSSQELLQIIRESPNNTLAGAFVRKFPAIAATTIIETGEDSILLLNRLKDLDELARIAKESTDETVAKTALRYWYMTYMPFTRKNGLEVQALLLEYVTIAMDSKIKNKRSFFDDSLDLEGMLNLPGRIPEEVQDIIFDRLGWSRFKIWIWRMKNGKERS